MSDLHLQDHRVSQARNQQEAGCKQGHVDGLLSDYTAPHPRRSCSLCSPLSKVTIRPGLVGTIPAFISCSGVPVGWIRTGNISRISTLNNSFALLTKLDSQGDKCSETSCYEQSVHCTWPSVKEEANESSMWVILERCQCPGHIASNGCLIREPWIWKVLPSGIQRYVVIIVE
jgi:hypothetical protein